MAHRIGIIGLGVMGQRMLRNIGLHRDLQVTTAWDPAPAAREMLAREFPKVRPSPDAAALAAADDVDCVYIASPPASHLAHAALGFDRGKPVFCEKPLSVDVESCRRMVERVEAEGLTAAVNFPHASAPAVLAIATALEAGELGSVGHVELEVAFQAWPRAWQAPAKSWLGERAEGGFVREVISHFVFTARRLFGPLAVETARVDYPDDGHSAETSIDAWLRAGELALHIGGGVGGAVMDHNAMTVLGSDGSYRLHGWYNLQKRTAVGWGDVDFGIEDLRQASYMKQLDSLAAMLSGEPHPLATFREGYEVQLIVEALLEKGQAGA